MSDSVRLDISLQPKTRQCTGVFAFSAVIKRYHLRYSRHHDHRQRHRDEKQFDITLPSYWPPIALSFGIVATIFDMILNILCRNYTGRLAKHASIQIR